MEESDQLKNSLTIAKAGYENAQACIRVMDTKAGAAVGILTFFIPAPFAFVVWATKLENETAKAIWKACCEWRIVSFFGLLALSTGIVCGIIAMLHGIRCLSPRVPKGHGKASAFHNECQPNVLFPMYEPYITDKAREHFKRLSGGVSMDFVVGEYERQIIEVGRIMDEKFGNMAVCFARIQWMLRAYIVAIAFGLIIVLKVWIRSS
jgi:hypothetical protein